MQNCKVSRDLNPPIESKLSRDNLDSIGGFKSRDTLQFCIPSLDEASNLENTVQHTAEMVAIDTIRRRWPLIPYGGGH